MVLDAGRLRVLVEVAHAGSIAAAAERMAFTASAVSQQLAKLEREAGTRLLDRGPSGVRLTGPGEVLLAHAERVLGELRDAEDAVRAAVAGEPERLAIGTFATAGKVLVPGALAALRLRRPGVRLSLVDLEPPAGYGRVTARELDLLITHRYPGMPSTPLGGLRRHRLLDDPLLVVLPPAHGLASRRRVALAELADDDWICGGRGVPNRTCLEHLWTGPGPHVAYETADYEVTLALVASGLGVSLVPASLLGGAGAGAGVAVCRLAGGVAREICLVHRRRPAALVGELVAVLHEVAATIATLGDGPRAASTL